VNEDLVLLPEVQARRLLGDRHIRLQVLAPYGSWTGSGTLRVLRVTFRPSAARCARAQDDIAQGDSVESDDVELVAGYESYQA
jgi:hypothetical protein